MSSQDPATASRQPRYGLRHIRAFVCMADELHFGRAAGKLCMAQPALSRTIRSLEESLGVALFQRSTRNVRLTSAGKAFAADCRLAMSYLDLAASAAKNAASGRALQLRVAYTDIAIDGRLPKILQLLRDQAAGVSIDLKYMPTTAQHGALSEGRIDVGFITGDFKAQKIEKLLVDEQEFVVLLPEGHRLASHQSVRLADLAREPFVIGSQDSFASFRTLLFDLCKIGGFYPRIVQEVPDSNGIFGLVAARTGISIYAGCARNAQRSGVIVKSIEDARLKVPIYAAWLADHPSDALRRLLMILQADRIPEPQ